MSFYVNRRFDAFHYRHAAGKRDDGIVTLTPKAITVPSQVDFLRKRNETKLSGSVCVKSISGACRPGLFPVFKHAFCTVKKHEGNNQVHTGQDQECEREKERGHIVDGNTD